ncbi:MAG: hypothetical protein H6974_12800 [Gammaproteobacteria bacterium]|nr:hypothetical protein [Gammaproteobacteria bacterium]
MNLWTQFNELIQPGGPMRVGEVVSVESGFNDQRCTVTILPGTATMQVIGTGRSLEVGQRWIIQDGRIIDEAPSGTVVVVEV